MSLKQIEIEYQKFFTEFGIDLTSGVLKEFPKLKFATMPHIGSNYFSAKKKILFIGLDIGKDETHGRYQDLAERNSNIECDINFNPHIAGTYCSAVYLLKELYDWENIWNIFLSYPTYSKATKIQHHKDGENPLSYVSLTNLHKFVTNEREDRAGDVNRKFLKREVEELLLLKEIEILEPDLVFFQGKLPSSGTVQKIKENKVKIILASHPSYRVKGGRKPQNYIDTFREI
jgi:hypothetical protein